MAVALHWTYVVRRLLFLLGDCLEGCDEVLVELLATVDVGALVGAVGAVECGAEGDHLHVGVFAAEEAALETCVDCHDCGFFLVEFLVGGLHGLEELAVHVGFPAGICSGELAFAAAHFGEADESFGEDVLGGVDAGADECHEGKDFAVGADFGEVEGGFDEVFHVVAHALNAVGGDHHHVDELLGVGFGHDFGAEANFLAGGEEVGLDGGEFFLDPAGDFVEFFEDAVDVLFGHCEDYFGVAGDGVAEGSAVDADEADAAFGNPAEHAEHDFVGVGAAGVDFHAAVAAEEAADGELVGAVAFGCGLGGVGDAHGGVDAAGAADIEFALGFGVEVEEEVAFEFAFLEAEGAGHAGFFVGGDEGFDGAVLDGLAFEDGHCCCYSEAVVGAEGGVACVDPTINDLGFDGVFEEVVDFACAGLGNHVHVCLEDDGTAIFHAFGGGLAHDDVADGVDTAVDFIFLCPVDEEFADGFFVLGGTRATGKGIEIAPQLFRFKIFDSHSVL